MVIATDDNTTGTSKNIKVLTWQTKNHSITLVNVKKQTMILGKNYHSFWTFTMIFLKASCKT